MKFKLKNSEIRDIDNALFSIGCKEGIGVIEGFVVATNRIALKPLVEAADAAKEKLFDKYGKKDEKGNVLTQEGTANVILRDVRGYHKDFEKLMNVEVEVELTTISKDGIKTLNPTPNQIMALMPIITDSEK